jgi:PX domain
MKYVSSSLIQMEIVTYPFKWKVTRSHHDFYALRDYLLKKYPQTIIPPLPRFNAKRKYTAKQLVKREIYYGRFLAMVLKSMVLRSSEFLVEFLKESNTDQFMLKALGAQ